MSNVRIINSGKYFPDKLVYSDEFDKRFNLENGTTYRKSGVKCRHYANKDETLSKMAFNAVNDVLKKSLINKEDIGCIIFSGGVPQQPIPCTASLIQKELGLENSGIPCFDINSTCLSFVTAFDTAAYAIDKYKTILLVTADNASVGIDYEDFNSSILFGDAACAILIRKSEDKETSKILTYKLVTYSQGTDYACIKGGGSLMHSREYCEETKKNFLFHMDGMKIYELASKKIAQVYNEALNSANLSIDDIKLVIPHQASLMSMKLIQKKLRIPKEKFLYNIENQGNTIASSIPLGIDYAIENKLIQRGDKVMLLGTSAGLSIGVMIFEY